MEFVQIDVEGTIEAERTGDARNDLSDQPVQVGEGRRGDAEVAAADVVNGLIVNHEGAVDMLEGGVGGQNGVVLQSE